MGMVVPEASILDRDQPRATLDVVVGREEGPTQRTMKPPRLVEDQHV